MDFVFIFGSSKTITRVLRFNVEDVDNLNCLEALLEDTAYNMSLYLH